jgi:HK97 family phage prohead protease
MNKIFLKGHIEKSGDKKTYKFLASTSSIDRQGDSIDQSGWELINFKKNPVLLWAHRYDELPIGKVVDIQITERGLEADVVFADHQKAQEVKALVDDGALSTVSVGFIPKERNGNIITRAELLEISIVPVPANQEAILLSKEITEAIKKDIEDVLSGEPADVEETPVEEVVEPVEVIVEPSEGIVVEEVEQKSGRVISKKNRKALEDTMGALKSALSEIEKLLAIEVATTDDEEVDEKSDYVVVPKSLIENLKADLRNENRLNDKVLSIFKKLD